MMQQNMCLGCLGEKNVWMTFILSGSPCHNLRTQVPTAAIAQSALSPGGNLPATCLAGGSQLDKELVGASFGLDSKHLEKTWLVALTTTMDVPMKKTTLAE
jgi:hypothetical protein